MNRMDQLAQKMIQFDRGYPELIQHCIKVHAFAHMIGIRENLDTETQHTVEAAALVHDIGIRVCLEKYGRETGVLQEQEGPAYAQILLKECGFEEKRIRRISYLVGHHHTYSNIDGIDHQILIEADFLVNIFENAYNDVQIQSVKQKIFKTKSGIHLLETMYIHSSY